MISFGLFGREDIFTEVVTNPDSFWLILEVTPVVLTFIFFLLFIKLFAGKDKLIGEQKVPISSDLANLNINKFSYLFVLVSFTTLALNPNFFRYNIWELFNETFSFGVVFLYFWQFRTVLRKFYSLPANAASLWKSLPDAPAPGSEKHDEDLGSGFGKYASMLLSITSNRELFGIAKSGFWLGCANVPSIFRNFHI